ncbi:MAG TPA: ABC transporter permease [Pyrinomonadaceae bacterium]|nr:ABC transporter permease [Pyrinomonadaceae bacterium]
MESLLRDLRYGLRGLLKRPGFAATVILTLAVGIGASTTIFTVLNSVMLRRLPYRTADRIVAIQELNPEGERIQITAANFLDWRAQSTVFEQLAAIKTADSNLVLADQAERINVTQTSANFFDVFGVAPQRGRLFVPADEQAGHEPIVILSDVLWRRRFAADPATIGKQINLDGKSYTVTGIAPAGFQYPDRTEAWLPPLRLVPEFNATMDVTTNRGRGYLSAVGLLKPGVSQAQAASEMDTITSRLRQQYPETNNGRFNRVVSLQEHLVGKSDTMLWLLFGAVLFVLLIACANVANLLLASAAARSKEMAIRAALGASRARVMRQLLTESTLLALAGGGLGLLLAIAGVAAVKAFLPPDFPRVNEIGMDWRVLGFTLGASMLTGFLFGLAPALHVSKTDVQEAMKENSRGTVGSAGRTNLRNALIVAEVALSVVLLAGAGLLFRSFLRLQAVNTGFTPQQVLTAKLSPSGPKFKGDPEYTAFYNQVAERVRTIPGVQEVGVVTTLPLSKGPTAGYRVEGRPVLPPDQWPPTYMNSVSPDYFRAMNIPIVQGRAFNAQDNEKAPWKLMINQAAAERDFPGESAVGKRITFGNTDKDNQPVWFEIVGVAANIRSVELREEPSPELYFTTLQYPFEHMAVVIRSTVEPISLGPSLRQAVAEVDRSVPVSEIKTMDHIISESVTQPRFNLFLLAIFSGVALLLSAAGIYGVTAYSVTQRTQELGIRLALGAQVSDILKMVLRQGMIVIAVGLVIGLLAAFALTRLMRSLLFGIGENDPITFVAITLVLVMVALFACYIPARRASRVDPLIALRYE